MAPRINASGEYLRRTTSLPSSTSFTLCGWVNITRRASVFQYWGLEDGSNFLALGYSDDAGNVFEIYNGGSVNFGSSPSDGTWFFYAITCEGTGASDFKGYWAAIGSSTWDETVTATGVSFTPDALYIGNDSFDEYMNAVYAYQKVYDAALTSDELLAEMHSILPKRTANLHAFWPMFPGATERLRDYSGNGRNLTAGGTLTDEDPPPTSWGAEPLFSQFVTAPAAANLPIMVSKMHPSKNILLRL